MSTTSPLPTAQSLLDRLVDSNAAEQPGKATPLTQRVDAVRSGIRRDLEALLNSRRFPYTIPRDLLELRISAHGYGLPDIATAPLVGGPWREQLRAEIASTIARYEPRLQSVQVALLDADKESDRRLKFRIDAIVRLGAQTEGIVFDTSIDPRTREIEVRE